MSADSPRAIGLHVRRLADTVTVSVDAPTCNVTFSQGECSLARQHMPVRSKS